MKIASFGLDVQPGKHKYHCQTFDTLVEKFSPQKATPYTVEFIGEDFEKADAVIYAKVRQFDYVFFDLEKIEKRLQRGPEQKEQSILEKAQGLLEREVLLCDAHGEFTEEEHGLLKNLSFGTYKPSLAVERGEDRDKLIADLLKKAQVFLFFTAGKKEVHAWSVKQGATVVEAAGRIHSDLARGFIKADVTKAADLDKFFNMAEARAKGLVQTVGKEYLIQAEDIIEVKFNV